MLDKFFDLLTSKKDQKKSRYIYKVAPKKKIYYPECDKGGLHTGQPLNYICTNSFCQKSFLCCSVCIQQSHKYHQYSPLKLIIGRAQYIIDKKGLNGVQNTQVHKYIEKVKEKYFQQINRLKKGVVQKVQNYAESIYRQINLNLKKLYNTLSIYQTNPKKYIQKLYSALQLKDFIKYSKQLAHIVQMENKDDIAYDKNAIRKKIKTFQQEIEEEIKGASINIYTILEESSKKMESYNLNKLLCNKSNYQFSSLLHQDLSQVNMSRIKSQKNYSYKFALVNEQIKEQTPIIFKLSKGSQWSAVGICDKNVIIDNKYGFNFNQIGHGAYMISSNGGSWSHSDKKLNNVIKVNQLQQTFTLKQNDRVRISYCKKNYEVVFAKVGTGDKYTLKVDKQKVYYPCAILYYPSDELQILKQ